MALPPHHRRAGLKRFTVLAFLSVVLGLGSLQALWIHLTRIPEPQVVVPPAQPLLHDGDRTRSGDSFLEHRGGIWVMGHKGSAVEIGVAHAILGQELNTEAEHILFAELDRWVPYVPAQILMSKITQWQYRKVLPKLPAWFTEELWGYAQNYDDPYAYTVSTYQRLLYYHLLHDITQEIPGDSPLLACTAWSATASATTDGHLLLGRNFDFEVFDIFDKEKVVHIYARDGAIPFASVAWMGLAGVVTGLNAEGIWISVNAARSEGHNREGLPVIVLARQVMEEATSLDEAIAILSARPTLVTDIYLLGDGKTGETAVLERGVVKGRVGVRGPNEDGLLLAANHLLTPDFAGDSRNQTILDGTSTLARYQRSLAVLEQAPLGSLDIPAMAALARDRRNRDGQKLAPGNRNAVDAFIATHSVLADAKARTLWVAQAPHTLGRYHRIDLLAELDAMGVDTRPYRKNWEPGYALDLEPDPFLEHGWPRLQETRDAVEEGWSLLKKNPSGALDQADLALQKIPQHPEALFLRARALDALDRPEAQEAFRTYLDAQPERGRDLERARKELGLSPSGTVTAKDAPRHAPR